MPIYFLLALLKPWQQRIKSQLPKTEHTAFFPLQLISVIYLFIHSKKQPVEETLFMQEKTHSKLKKILMWTNELFPNFQGMTNLLISSVISSSAVNLVFIISVSEATGEGSAATEPDVPLANPASSSCDPCACRLSKPFYGLLWLCVGVVGCRNTELCARGDPNFPARGRPLPCSSVWDMMEAGRAANQPLHFHLPVNEDMSSRGAP